MKTTSNISLTLFGALLVLTGCVSPLPSSREALANGQSGDGVVVGSVLLQLEEAPAATKNLTFTVKIRQDRKLAPHRYTFTAPANQEKLFDGSLPAGDYWVDSIHCRVSIPNGYLSEQEKLLRDWYKAGRRFGNQVDPAVRFHVNPGQTTYIGQLMVNLPRRFEIGSRFTVEIRDEEPKTMEALKNQDSPLLLSGLQKKLMTASFREMTLVEPADSADPGYIYFPINYQPHCHQSGGHSSHGFQRNFVPSSVGHSPSFGHGGRF